MTGADAPPTSASFGRSRTRRGFEATRVWVFDLDNTLYPASCNLFAAVDQRMGEFIARYLGVPFAHARHLQKTYYRQFGTTLCGLMRVHGLDPRAFLDYVHDIDLSVVPELPELAAAIGALPGRKLILTNGSRRHAEKVAGKLGVLHCFEDIFDIASSNYVPKPRLECYEVFIRTHGIDAGVSAMFEDIVHNLEAPHALGMTTVLVHPQYAEDPTAQPRPRLLEPPEHVHHMTDDLERFLRDLSNARSGAAEFSGA